jgi:Methylase involved in ubiquinone/menaquinone biosynthesis
MSSGPGTFPQPPAPADSARVPARIETVRRQFDRRADRFARHDAIVREVERRLLERLDLMRLDPQWIVDVGCGAGRSRGLLQVRYPRAAWIGVDLSARMLSQHAGRGPRWARWLDALRRRSPPLVQAEAAALPLADGRADLVVSNLMVHWHPAPHSVFPEFRRVLRTDGLLLFSCFGPDTLAQLRSAFAAGWPQARPMPFVDMHDFGDMMVAAGFAGPVMDVETLQLTFGSAEQLMREVAALGGNPRADRPAALPGSRRARAVHDALQAQCDAQGRLALTFEVAYGHGWCAAPRSPRNASVPLQALRRSAASVRRPSPSALGEGSARTADR